MAKSLEDIEVAFRQKYSSAKAVGNGHDHSKTRSGQEPSRRARRAGTTVAFGIVLIIIIIVAILFLMEENRKKGSPSVVEDIGINALVEPAVTLALAPGPTVALKPRVN